MVAGGDGFEHVSRAGPGRRRRRRSERLSAARCGPAASRRSRWTPGCASPRCRGHASPGRPGRRPRGRARPSPGTAQGRARPRSAPRAGPVPGPAPSPPRTGGRALPPLHERAPAPLVSRPPGRRRAGRVRRRGSGGRAPGASRTAVRAPQGGGASPRRGVNVASAPPRRALRPSRSRWTGWHPAPRGRARPARRHGPAVSGPGPVHRARAAPSRSRGSRTGRPGSSTVLRSPGRDSAAVSGATSRTRLGT